MSREIRRAREKKGETVSETIEKRHQTHPIMYVGLVVLLVVIVVSFVLAGPGGIMGRGNIGNGGNIVFGAYNGQEISYVQGNYFSQQVQQYASQVQGSNAGTGNTDNTAQTYQVWYQAFMGTAEHYAILQQADRAGVNISEDAVDKSLLSYPGYLDENGKFSEDKFTAASAADKASTRKITRENLRSGTFVNDLAGGIKDGTKETEFIKTMMLPERSFNFVSLPFTSFPNEEVRKYGEANKSRFVREKLSRILVKTSEAQATEIRKKILDKTSSFEELAKTYSKDSYADKGGDMGWRYAYDLEADFDVKANAQKVLALKTGDVSDVLKGTFGWMIYRCDTEATDADFTNAAIQADVRTYITTYEKGKIEDYFNERAGQLSRRSAEVGFNAAAREMGLKVSSTLFFPVNLSSVFSFVPLKATVDADTPANAANSEDFFYRAFTLGKDQVSAPVVLDDQVLVLQLKGEQQMADSAAAIVSNWVPYVANQSLQYDLYSVMMTPDKLTNNFDAAFSTYVAPSSRKQ